MQQSQARMVYPRDHKDGLGTITGVGGSTIVAAMRSHGAQRLVSGPGEMAETPDREGTAKVVDHDDDQRISLLRKNLDVQRTGSTAVEWPGSALVAGQVGSGTSSRVCRAWGASTCQ